MEGPIVRYVDQTTASIWVSFRRQHAVAVVVFDPETEKPVGRPRVVNTVQVGGNHYAIPFVTGLVPDKIYGYWLLRLDTSSMKRSRRPKTASQLKRHEDVRLSRFRKLACRGQQSPLFRTQPAAKSGITHLAFGSCRKWLGGAHSKPGSDALELYAAELDSSTPKRWPSMLLLIGDQIYADDVNPVVYRDLRRRRRELARNGEPVSVPRRLGHPREAAGPPGVKEFHLLDFHEFAWVYELSLAEQGVRKVLANMATYMTFDDHEITDDWNITGGWVEQMEATKGWDLVIVDGLIAYWMYQGWGNHHPDAPSKHPLSKILAKYAGRDKDALDALRKATFAQLYARYSRRFRWDFQVPSSPPIYFMDVRNDRILRRPKKDRNGKVIDHASHKDRIVSKRQLKELLAKVGDNDDPIILVSSVPVIMPWPIFSAGLLIPRPTPGSGWFKRLQKQNDPDDFEHILRRGYDFDQWSSFPASFEHFLEFNKKVREKTKGDRTIIVLSGDVHFSYAMEGRLSSERHRNMPFLIQLVGSPLQNAVTKDEAKQLAKVASWLRDEDIGMGKLPNSGVVGPGFNSTSQRAKPLVKEGLLFGNSIATFELSAQHGWVRAFWLSASISEKKLERATSYIRSNLPRQASAKVTKQTGNSAGDATGLRDSNIEPAGAAISETQVEASLGS